MARTRKTRHQIQGLHALMRLHERFGIGAGQELLDAVNEAIAHAIRTKDYRAAHPIERGWWLLNIAGTYVAFLWRPDKQTVVTAYYPHTHSYRAAQVLSQQRGRLTPITVGITKHRRQRLGCGRRSMQSIDIQES